MVVLVLGGVFDGHWRWVDFGGDLARNALVGTLLAGAVAWEAENRRRSERDAKIQAERRGVRQMESIFELAANGWSPLEKKPANADDLRVAIKSEVTELTKVANELEEVYDIESGDAACFAMDTLSGAVANYLGEGNRKRRKLYLNLLNSELADLVTGNDPELAEAVRKFRETIPAVLAWYSHANTVVLERILAERLTAGAHLGQLKKESLDLISVVKLSDAVSIHEPMYLLYAYSELHSAQAFGDSEVAKLILGQVKRCVGALRNEVNAVIDSLNALMPVMAKASSLVTASPSHD